MAQRHLSSPSWHARFDDPDAFAASIHNTQARVLPDRTGAYAADLALVRLPGVHLVLTRESLARRFICHPSPARLFFRLKPAEDPPSIRNGEAEPSDTIAVNRHGAKVDDRTPGAAVVRNLSISLDDLAARAEALLDRSVPGILGERQRVRPAQALFAELARLHEDAARLAARDPAALAHPVAASMLDARLGEVLLAALARASTRPETAAARRGHAIMHRVMAFIEAHDAQPVSLTQLCQAGRCSAKRLELLFLETFGQTPMRHLRQRRLWLARQALLTADPANTTVSHVAMDCGFWELGRFAAAYRQQFGELPSMTLHSHRAAAGAPRAAA